MTIMVAGAVDLRAHRGGEVREQHPHTEVSRQRAGFLHQVPVAVPGANAPFGPRLHSRVTRVLHHEEARHVDASTARPEGGVCQVHHRYPWLVVVGCSERLFAPAGASCIAAPADLLNCFFSPHSFLR